MNPILKIGTAAVDITPDGVCDLTGFAARTQPALGVHDPVCARALFFEDGTKRIALVVCDLLGLEPPTDAAFRESLSSEHRLDGLILACTHTHSGPASMRLIQCGEMNPAYLDVVKERLSQAIGEASRGAVPATMRGVRTEVSIGMNRRATLNGETRLISSEKDRPEGASAGLYDPTLNILQWADVDGGILATLFNHECHAVSLGHEFRYVSCDYPGVAIRSLERASDPGGYGMPVFLQGACGDVNPDLKVRGWVGGERIGMELAEAVREGAKGGADDLPVGPMRFAEKRLTLPFRNDAGEIEVTVSALRLGDAAIATLPGEAFCQLGKTIREESPFDLTLVSAYANGNLGYIPTREAYALGGYEVDSAYYYYGYPECVTPEAGERCVEAALELLRACESGE